ncbi:M20/M25/M40 family metallo-hydrolase, partial [Clostridioides difficile]
MTKHQPYKGEETNGRIYGRGVLDNKGPIMSALYGLYAIKELNLK